MLRDLTLKAVYRSEQDNLLTDFYIPVLKEAISYDRAVGFFSASMLSYAAQGLSVFVQRGDSRMRLILGSFLDDQDVQAVAEGYASRDLEEKIGLRLVEGLDQVPDSLFQKRFELLSYLVGSGLLDVRIALRQKGMYHEKIGILTDQEGDTVVFQGSANETIHGLLPDFTLNQSMCFRRGGLNLQNTSRRTSTASSDSGETTLLGPL